MEKIAPIDVNHQSVDGLDEQEELPHDGLEVPVNEPRL